MRLVFTALLSLILFPVNSIASLKHACPELDTVRVELASQLRSMTHADFWVTYEPGHSDATGMDFVSYPQGRSPDQTAALSRFARKLVMLARKASCSARLSQAPDMVLVSWMRLRGHWKNSAHATHRDL